MPLQPNHFFRSHWNPFVVGILPLPAPRVFFPQTQLPIGIPSSMPNGLLPIMVQPIPTIGRGAWPLRLQALHFLPSPFVQLLVGIQRQDPFILGFLRRRIFLFNMPIKGPEHNPSPHRFSQRLSPIGRSRIHHQNLIHQIGGRSNTSRNFFGFILGNNHQADLHYRLGKRCDISMTDTAKSLK